MGGSTSTAGETVNGNNNAPIDVSSLLLNLGSSQTSTVTVNGNNGAPINAASLLNLQKLQVPTAGTHSVSEANSTNLNSSVGAAGYFQDSTVTESNSLTSGSTIGLILLI